MPSIINAKHHWCQALFMSFVVLPSVIVLSVVASFFSFNKLSHNCGGDVPTSSHPSNMSRLEAQYIFFHISQTAYLITFLSCRRSVPSAQFVLAEELLFGGNRVVIFCNFEVAPPTTCYKVWIDQPFFQLARVFVTVDHREGQEPTLVFWYLTSVRSFLLINIFICHMLVSKLMFGTIFDVSKYWTWLGLNCSNFFSKLECFVIVDHSFAGKAKSLLPFAFTY